MTTLREAAQQALEALEWSWGGEPMGTLERAAITALRAALAEPVQEPEELKDPAEYDDFAAAIRHNERVTTRRYDSVGPVALETVYEIIIHWDEGGGKRSRRELARRIVDLYTAPPQRKPLTEVELDQRYYVSTGQMLREQDKRLAFLFARAVEHAHGIKE